MSRPKAHYSMVVKNHETGERLKVELIDLPFVEIRRFRVRVTPLDKRHGVLLRLCPAVAYGSKLVRGTNEKFDYSLTVA